jgi:nucleoside 2-deoxyribosyltransferase
VRQKIYLAGPEVFLSDALSIAQAKKAICEESGFEGVFPLDTNLDLQGLSGREAGLRISRANESLIRAADLLIANMTPFRGPSMDVGTAYEMGFMRALGRPVLGYTNSAEPLLERTIRLCSGRREASEWVDAQGLQIENFGLTDNLMLEGAVVDSGAEIVRHAAAAESLFTDLTAFAECVRRARRMR